MKKVGMLLIIIGACLLVWGSSGFTQVTAERNVDIDIAPEGEGMLQFETQHESWQENIRKTSQGQGQYWYTNGTLFSVENNDGPTYLGYFDAEITRIDRTYDDWYQEDPPLNTKITTENGNVVIVGYCGNGNIPSRSYYVTVEMTMTYEGVTVSVTEQTEEINIQCQN